MFLHLPVFPVSFPTWQTSFREWQTSAINSKRLARKRGIEKLDRVRAIGAADKLLTTSRGWGDRKNTGLGTWLPCILLQIGRTIQFSYGLSGSTIYNSINERPPFRMLWIRWGENGEVFISKLIFRHIIWGQHWLNDLVEGATIVDVFKWRHWLVI